MVSELIDKKFLYRTISDDIRKLIKNSLKPGELLPTRRVLEKKYGVSAGTMTKVIKELEAEGLVHKQHGRGVYVLDYDYPLIGIVNIIGLNEEQKKNPMDYILSKYVSKGAFRYQVYHWEVGEYPSVEFIRKEGLKGLITLGVFDLNFLNLLSREGIRVVSMDSITGPVPGLDCVGFDSFKSGDLAVQTLVARGHKDIAYVGFQKWDPLNARFIPEPDSELVAAGVQFGLLSNQIKPHNNFFLRWRNETLLNNRKDSFSIEDIFDQLFRSKKKPTAIVFFENQSAVLFQKKCIEEGLKIPEDVSIVTRGVILNKGRKFTSIGLDHDQLYNSAVNQLLHLMSREQSPQTSRVLLDPKIFDEDVTVITRN